MTRSRPSQPDLFAKAAPPDPVPPADPIAELSDMLTMLRAASEMPWQNLMEAATLESRARALAGIAGSEGKRLLSAVFDEIERLFSAAEQPQPA